MGKNRIDEIADQIIAKLQIAKRLKFDAYIHLMNNDLWELMEEFSAEVDKLKEAIDESLVL